uniref:Uncharacterized protein n=1 Tax=Glossina morsitans morsitans TaxID=37546 RepID=A0A1B0G0Z5_GLOMM
MTYLFMHGYDDGDEGDDDDYDTDDDIQLYTGLMNSTTASHYFDKSEDDDDDHDDGNDDDDDDDDDDDCDCDYNRDEGSRKRKGKERKETCLRDGGDDDLTVDDTSESHSVPNHTNRLTLALLYRNAVLPAIVVNIIGS